MAVRRLTWLVLAWGSVALFPATPSAACDLPVYAQALRAWPTERLELLILHGAELTPGQQATVEALGDRQEEAGGLCNVQVRTVLRGPDMPAEYRVLDRGAAADAPACYLLYPPRPGEPRIAAWSGPLTPQAAANLVDSPARQALARGLGEGATAVWVILRSGRERDDRLLADRLGAHLAEAAAAASQAAASADGGGDEPGDVYKPPPVRCHILTIAPDDPREQAFIQMLLNSSDGLREKHAAGALVFPFFGRGRLLWGLTAEQVTPEAVAQTVEFLNGPCVCEITAINPGLTVLFSADWLAGSAAVGEPPSLASLLDSAAADTPALAPADAAAPSQAVSLWPIAAAAAALAAATAALTRWAWRRKGAP